MTFLETDFGQLGSHLSRSGDEQAAYIAARVVTTPQETRFLVRKVNPVPTEDLDAQSPVHLEIPSRSYVPAIKRSKLDESAFVFVHSHPGGPDDFSPQDEREEPPLFALAHDRNPQPAHASLVASRGAKAFRGRVWLPNGSTAPIDLIRVIGARWRFLFRDGGDGPLPEYFDRQVRAFGSEIQRLLGRLHVGIVGAGGTGSAVAEQLVRLGLGELTIIDPDRFEPSNVNRVYGSSTFDAGIPKVTIAARHAHDIALGTRVNPIHGRVGFRSVTEKLLGCDLVFGCTDDQWGRSVLTRLAVYYAIPVIDLGVIIDPDGEMIRSIHGRVTMLQPGYACLYCRERTDPARAAELASEGYIAGVQAPAPAVGSFTTAVAAAGVAELLDRVTGYKTAEAKPSEFLLRFEADAFSRNHRPPLPTCFCTNDDTRMAGDRPLFLGMTWAQE